MSGGLVSLWSAQYIAACVLAAGLVCGYVAMKLGARFWDHLRRWWRGLDCELPEVIRDFGVEESWLRIEFGEWRWDGIEFGAVAMALKVDPIDIFK